MGSSPSVVRFFVKGFATLALAGLVGASFGAVPAEPGVVGEATLVIGVAKVIGADGVALVMDRGTPVHVGDRIETGAGGHVHLRFVDGGRLSVRPSSRLQVENYSRNVEQPDLTAIKFRLDEGVVRSITGTWGEAARDRFRLNTPVAAIGVKGTDFVVKSDTSQTLATVYTGAIVLSPLSGACLASLGPCANGAEKLLSDDMKGQMLSLSGLQATPQLVAAVDLLAQRARPSVNEVVVARQEPVVPATFSVEKTTANESRAIEVVSTQAGLAVEQAQRPPVVTPAPVVTPVAVVTPVPVVTPLPVVIAPPVVTQLIWARLATVAADGDTISRSHAQALATGFTSTLGNLANSLYRDTSKYADGVLTTAEVSASFRLAGSAASLIWNDRGTDVIDAAQVTGGKLNVDFAHASYTTQINVNSNRIGSDTLKTDGMVTSNGLLRGSGNGISTGGALSLDGKEAGYFFEKTYTAGQLRGITLWGR